MTSQKLLSFTIKEHEQHNLMAELTGGRCCHAIMLSCYRCVTLETNTKVAKINLFRTAIPEPHLSLVTDSSVLSWSF